MSSKKLNYSSIGKTVDGTTFCSGVETLAENIIEDNEADSVIVFPSETGWASLRSSSYRMTDQNTEAHLPLPIYKIKRVLIKPDNFSAGIRIQGEVASLLLSDFVDVNGEKLDYFDATYLIYNAIEWDSFPIANLQTDEDGYYNYVSGVYKDNTFYWEEI